MTNKKYFFLIILMVALLNTSLISAQNVRYASYDSIMNSIPEYKNAMKELMDKTANYQAQIKNLESELSKKYDLFSKNHAKDIPLIQQGNKDKLAPEVTKELEMLEKEKEYIKTQTTSYNELLQLFITKNITAIKDKVNLILNNYCKKNKIATLLNLDTTKTEILFLDNSQDLTQQFKALVKQQYKS